MEPNIKLICQECGKEFERRATEHRRNLKLERLCFCSLSCSSSYGCKNNKRTITEKAKESWKENALKGSRAKWGKFSPFREILRRVRKRFKRAKEKYLTWDEPDLTIEYLQKIWEDQKGICPYTGYKMNLPKNSKENLQHQTLYSASLDRIDPFQSYVQGNVEFVCTGINFLKNDFSKEEVIEFLSKINHE